MERFSNSIEEAIDCRTSGRLKRGEDHGYESESEMSVIAWNTAFVVVGESSSEYCGGLHPVTGAGATTYNLRTGKVDEVSPWLIEQYRQEIPKDSPLGKLILKNYSQADECDDSVELSGEIVWPTRTGIVFRPTAPYAQSGCIEDIIVPYKSISPYLSPQGKTNAQTFQRR